MSNITWMILGVVVAAIISIPFYVMIIRALLKEYIRKGFIEMDGELFLIIDVFLPKESK